MWRTKRSADDPAHDAGAPDHAAIARAVERDGRLLEARYGDLLESVPDAIVVSNRFGRILLANGQAEALFGFSRAELHGQPIETLMPPRFRAAHVDHRSTYLAHPRSRPMGAGLELYAVRKNGEEFPVEISLSPLRIDEQLLVMTALRDITERKRVERALQEKNVELERASLAKDRFLASMSHELRTPMNAIIGFTGTLLMRLPGPLTPEQEHQLLTIQTSARHLLSLINDILDLAKIESGSVELLLEPVRCQDAVEQVVATLAPLAATKGLRFETEMPREGVEVRTDRRALRQILLNLGNNAIKFTDAGAVRIELAVYRDDGRAVTRIRVIDTGIGIDAEKQRRLFQPFTQLDSTTTRRYDGTGLGLHLSQKLAALIGGTIHVNSAQGQGSVFTLEIRDPAPGSQ